MSRKKIVIVGGGFAGLCVAKGLKKSTAEVLVVDKTNHHLFQPLLYQVASATLSPGDIAIPIREILRHQLNTSVLMGDVIKIDKKNQLILLHNGESIFYDFLVIAIGTRHAYFGKENWERFAPGLKTVQDAITIREEILISFEKAERLAGLPKAEKYLNFAIVGGGPTGVEMAGAIAEIAHNTLFQNFRKIEPHNAKIYLIEAAPHILPSYPASLSQRAQQDLEKLGVWVLTGKKVLDINSEGLQIEDQFYPCANIIWAAGNQVSPLLKTLDVPLDRQGRAIVEADLSIPGNPEIFVIGDAASVSGKDGHPLPGIAQAAIQEGKYVAKILRKNIPKESRPPFQYFDKGSMATIGKGKAIVQIRNLQFTGFFAWLMWCFIHILYLIGFKNRIAVMLEWMFYYVTGKKSARLIYRSIDDSLKDHES